MKICSPPMFHSMVQVWCSGTCKRKSSLWYAVGNNPSVIKIEHYSYPFLKEATVLLSTVHMAYLESYLLSFEDVLTCEYLQAITVAPPHPWVWKPRIWPNLGSYWRLHTTLPHLNVYQSSLASIFSFHKNQKCVPGFCKNWKCLPEGSGRHSEL